MTDKATIVTLGIMVIGGFTTGISLRFIIDVMADPDWTIAIWIPLAILGFSTLAFSERIERFSYERIFPDEIEQYQARQEKNRRLKEKITDDDRALSRKTDNNSILATSIFLILVFCMLRLFDLTVLDRELGYWQSAWMIMTPVIVYIIIVGYVHRMMKITKKYPESGRFIVFSENRSRFERTVTAFGIGFTIMTIVTVCALIFSCSYYMGETIVENHILIHIVLSAPLLLAFVGVMNWLCIDVSFADKNPRFIDE